MTFQLETLKQQRINKARVALQRARALRNSRRAFGMDGISQHIKDVDSDWFENWSVEEDTPLQSENYRSTP